ncbi:hypothetical protein [Mycoplasmopsis cynos]|uniref:hypothetical protein n=1 Tax=Mycoplasmopsis cynos TaxID=171284 RepID=UPI0030CD4E03
MKLQKIIFFLSLNIIPCFITSCNYSNAISNNQNHKYTDEEIIAINQNKYNQKYKEIRTRLRNEIKDQLGINFNDSVITNDQVEMLRLIIHRIKDSRPIFLKRIKEFLYYDFKSLIDISNKANWETIDDSEKTEATLNNILNYLYYFYIELDDDKSDIGKNLISFNEMKKDNNLTFNKNININNKYQNQKVNKFILSKTYNKNNLDNNDLNDIYLNWGKYYTPRNIQFLLVDEYYFNGYKDKNLYDRKNIRGVRERFLDTRIGYKVIHNYNFITKESYADEGPKLQNTSNKYFENKNETTLNPIPEKIKEIKDRNGYFAPKNVTLYKLNNQQANNIFFGHSSVNNENNLILDFELDYDANYLNQNNKYLGFNEIKTSDNKKVLNLYIVDKYEPGSLDDFIKKNGSIRYKPNNTTKTRLTINLSNILKQKNIDTKYDAILFTGHDYFVNFSGSSLLNTLNNPLENTKKTIYDWYFENSKVNKLTLFTPENFDFYNLSQNDLKKLKPNSFKQYDYKPYYDILKIK